MTTIAESTQGLINARPLGRFSRFLRGTTEFVVLVLVVLCPWFIGGRPPFAEFLLSAGVALLLLLWAMYSISVGYVRFPSCTITLFLTGLFLFGVVQIVPLPTGVLGVISPTTSELYQQLLPTVREELPNGIEAPPSNFPSGSTI